MFEQRLPDLSYKRHNRWTGHHISLTLTVYDSRVSLLNWGILEMVDITLNNEQVFCELTLSAKMRYNIWKKIGTFMSTTSS